MSALDTDLWDSASHRNMNAHLTGPLAAGAVDSRIPVVESAGFARVTVDWITREPLVVAALSAPLGAERVRLVPTVVDAGVTTELPALEYAEYTEAGAFLGLYLPPVAQTRTAQPFELTLQLIHVGTDGIETPVAAADIAGRVEIRLIEGVLGRTIYLLGLEQQRLRRQAREVAAMRYLSSARDSALDRIGSELAVPRFADAIVFDGAAVVTQARREPDVEYRRRLSIYYPFMMPNRRGLAQMLNGEGDAGDPNQGLLGGLGFADRFAVVEDDNPFAVAIHLVSAGDPALRANFLEFIRRVYLVWPQNNPQANMAHSARYLAQSRHQRMLELRARLRGIYDFNASAAVAPMLAISLDRVGRCRQALGEDSAWSVTRAQDGAGGSRYELGLGVDIAPPEAAELARLGDSLADPARAPDDDAEIEALLLSMTPRPAADDPEGRWFLEPCGIRTVHRIDTGNLYLSHLPTFGMAISGASDVNAGDQVALEARYHAPGDPGSNIVLTEALTAADADWTASGSDPWTILPADDAIARWEQAAPLPPANPALGVFRAAGLPGVENPLPVVTSLTRLPPELIETLALPAALAQDIVDGQPAAAETLRQIAGLLRAHGLASLLPLVTGPNEVVLVAGVIGLPQAGINLSERRATGFRWYAVPIQGAGGQVKAIGSRSTFVPAGSGLTALVAIGYARRGSTDPYEYRVELPDGALLDLQQYEFLMNLLEHAYPLGVEVNTFSLRREHVDLDGDGEADPLQPTISRTYRKFRRERHRGVAGVSLEDD